MKTKLFSLIFLLGTFVLASGQSFYDLNTINTIEITFEQSNWDQILDQYALAGDEERLMGSVTINGQVFDSVGVRYKGNSTYSPNQVKNPFNIKLDYIIDDQELDGYGTLKLSNCYKDPSMLRETLGYEIARNYFPASQANYANIYVNGTLIGLYTNVQDVDKYFMRTHLNNDEGVRLKGEITSNGPGGPTGSVWEYFGTDSTDYYNSYALESDYGWKELVNFLDTLKNHNEYIDAYLNIDRHLWFIAWSNLIVNLDGPINNPQNYYLFQDGLGRFNTIPWDLNESFGGYTNHQTLGNLSTTGMQQMNPYANINDSDFPVISKILNDDTRKKTYVAHMKTMIEEIFENGWYEDRALEIQDIISADVQADPNKFYSYNNFISNVNNPVGGGPMAVVGLTQLMESRVNYLMGLDDFEATQPEISDITVSPENPGAGTEIWINTAVDDADNVYFKYRVGSNAAFESVEMYDDGNHNDGAADDGVYGVSVVTGYADIQYYIFAENDDAVALSPEKAEYEFYTIGVTSDLVINEFMADNETTVTDQDGDYDDWIEFYNNGTEEIALLGFGLSDDASEPDQWIFPDTTIAAGGYLIVWADDDEDQEGLHANFKLSKSGESILLSDPELNAVDEINYDQQVTDTTYGRYPNGTGDFEFMPPTFGYENSLTTGVNYDDLVINEFLADNETIVADQDGEYDEWIEIYNNGTSDIDMSGMYLSNNEALPGMWEFPETTIAAGAYLIVWADNDVNQEGLHAGFVLEASGGSIIFSDPDENIVDEITYEDQLTDISTGRYPNGTGDFILMPPTYAAENTTSSTGLYDELVINEFMADNDSTVTDQDGEYEDWIEFYNNGNVELSLAGLYLSDDATEPNMWAFPDTTIAAGGYLIVWADEDEDQEGLHASFKISKSGESILLSEPTLSIIDEISFGEQLTDTTYGRYPNGTGSFEFMPPTFGTENTLDITGVEDMADVSVDGLNAFPNPFRDQLTISIDLSKSAAVKVELINIYGQTHEPLMDSQMAAGTHTLQIDTSTLPAGIWICTLQTGTELQTLKLLKTGN